MTSKARTAPLDAAVADRLLDLLSTDDLFRERFQRDPVASLLAIGYRAPDPATAVTACGAAVNPVPEPFRDCRVKQLASKGAIAEARDEIRSMLLHGLDQSTPKLDTGLNGVQRSLRDT